MRITFEFDGTGEASDFTELIQFLLKFPTKWRKLMSLLDDVKGALANQDAAIATVATYVADLTAKLDAIKDNPTAADVQAILEELNVHNAELQALVPASPAPTEPEAPVNPQGGGEEGPVS